MNVENNSQISINRDLFKDVRPLIFGYLDVDDLLTCEKVCKVWNKQIDEKSLWVQLAKVWNNQISEKSLWVKLAQEKGFEISHDPQDNRNQLAKESVIVHKKMPEITSLPKNFIDALGGEKNVFMLPSFKQQSFGHHDKKEYTSFPIMRGKIGQEQTIVFNYELNKYKISCINPDISEIMERFPFNLEKYNPRINIWNTKEYIYEGFYHQGYSFIKRFVSREEMVVKRNGGKIEETIKLRYL